MGFGLLLFHNKHKVTINHILLYYKSMAAFKVFIYLIQLAQDSIK